MVEFTVYWCLYYIVVFVVWAQSIWILLNNYFALSVSKITEIILENRSGFMYLSVAAFDYCIP